MELYMGRNSQVRREAKGEEVGSPIKRHLVKGKATPFVRKVQISYLQANSANQPPTSFPLP